MGAPLDEPALVGRARRGDLDAYEVLMTMHKTAAFRTAYLIVGAERDAEEIVQDAFVKAFRSLSRFRPGAAFRPWLLAIVGNEARNRRRANAVRPPLALADERPATDDASVSPELAALAADERRRLGAAIARLSPRDRDLIACRLLLGLSQAETAAVLGVQTGTVKSGLSRALARLREVWGDA